MRREIAMDAAGAGEAAWVLPALAKWALGAAWAAIVAAFTWVWATDRAVRAQALEFRAWREAEAKERKEARARHEEERRERERREAVEHEERKEWRAEIVESIKRLGERVGPLELERAKQQGREEARKENRV